MNIIIKSWEEINIFFLLNRISWKDEKFTCTQRRIIVKYRYKDKSNEGGNAYDRKRQESIRKRVPG